MREIKSGDIVMRIRASSLTIFFFKQEFGGDILKAFASMFKDMTKNGTINGDSIKIDNNDIFDVIPSGYEFLQILWSMHKTQNQAEGIQTPKFEQWMEKYSEISILEIFQDVIEEAMHGFFRTAPQKTAIR